MRTIWNKIIHFFSAPAAKAEEIRQPSLALEERVSKLAVELTEIEQELEAFTYSVSHDLRAPLRAIIGFSDILISDFSSQLDEDGQQFLYRIHDGGLKMNQLLDDMLLLSRINDAGLTFEEVDLAVMAEELFISQLRSTGDREIIFNPKPCPNANADRSLMELLLTNLISNAIKFTGKCESARIEFGSYQQEGENVFYFKDNGVGFDMKYLDKVFAPFQRLHHQDEFEGTGIGLSIVKRIIKRLNGRVWAESVPSQGTTIFFTL